ncbi:hypothetical protein IGI04_011445 [Brassica rapa subsp. trilocularis]|uniref:Uncharacterized protein n=1 Tax=Brassica rapa subsp. trilocularis TaxID=1813537 RepID=A0ABQ7N5B0_BRACM|nr:hypothetical protein IGI04_011445 [Brassica rapa subsp. trilocularis]
MNLKTLNIGSLLNLVPYEGVNEIMMESKGGNTKSSSSSLFYEAPLGYSIEDVRPNGGIKKFKSSVYSNCAKRPS